MNETIDRPQCSIEGCEKRGRHYFGSIRTEVHESGEWIDFDTGEAVERESDAEIALWDGDYEEVDYWECDEHFYPDPPDDGWDDGTEHVDILVARDNELDEWCPRCEVMNLCTCMATTERDGHGPAYVCFECGLVDRI
jgi:hypothetical protein